MEYIIKKGRLTLTASEHGAELRSLRKRGPCNQ